MLDLFADYSDKQSMKLVTPWSDFLTVKGIVTLKLRDGDGREIKTIGGNQVVYLGRHRLSRTICGDTTVAEKVVNTIKLAGGAVPDGGDHLNPTAVAVTDTGLFQTNAALIYTKNPVAATFNSVSGTTAPTATYVTTVASSVVNLLVNEAGLFFGTTGPIFAHYSFPTVDLRNTTNNSLEITWQFLF